MSAPLIGCIADDFTGATDLANQFVRAGLRVVQTIGVPQGGLVSAVDVVVVALKSRTVPAEVAVEESLAAHRWLATLGCQLFYFKVCSTFDSTAQGNIGPDRRQPGAGNASPDPLSCRIDYVCRGCPGGRASA